MAMKNPRRARLLRRLGIGVGLFALAVACATLAYQANFPQYRFFDALMMGFTSILLPASICFALYRTFAGVRRKPGDIYEAKRRPDYYKVD